MDDCKMSGEDAQLVTSNYIVRFGPIRIPKDSSLRAKIHALIKVVDAWDDETKRDIKHRYGVDGGLSKLDAHERVFYSINFT